MNAQVRGFWLGPWMEKESGDPMRVLKEVMSLLEDGTIRPEAGVTLRFATLLHDHSRIVRPLAGLC